MEGGGVEAIKVDKQRKDGWGTKSCVLTPVKKHMTTSGIGYLVLDKHGLGYKKIHVCDCITTWQHNPNGYPGNRT